MLLGNQQHTRLEKLKMAKPNVNLPPKNVGGWTSVRKVFNLEVLGVLTPSEISCQVFRNESLKSNILLIHGLHYHVGINCKGLLSIGCKSYMVQEWRSFSDVEINRMDYRALDFWQEWGTFLLNVVDKYKNWENQND